MHTRERLLLWYSLIVTSLLAVICFVGAVSKRTKLTQLDVERINIVEPDGRVRMVLSSRTRFPGAIIRGKERPFPREAAGILFYNDEATEEGGLIWGGKRENNGTAASSGHLSFDQYEQDQTVVLEGEQNGDRRSGKLELWDRPDFPIGELFDLTERTSRMSPEEAQRASAAFWSSHPKAARRAYLGRSPDGSVALGLHDKDGRPRIVLRVAADGTASIETRDENGNVTARLPAAK